MGDGSERLLHGDPVSSVRWRRGPPDGSAFVVLDPTQALVHASECHHPKYASQSTSSSSGVLPLYSCERHRLAHPQTPEGGELRRSGGAEGVGSVGGAGMGRPDIGLLDHDEPRFLKGAKQFCPRSQFQMFGKI